MATFSDQESSIQDGHPIRCYLFMRGAIAYAYTSADRDISLNNILFLSTHAAADGGMEQAGTTDAVTIDISLSAYSPLALLYKEYLPTQPLDVVVWDLHYQADMSNPNYVVSFIGRVINVSWEGQVKMLLNCQTIGSAVDNPGLRKCWQRPCSNTLYDSDCSVAPEAYKVDDRVLSFDGLTLTLALLSTATYPDGWFSGGYVAWYTADGAQEMRGIRTQVGRVLTLYGGTAGLAADSVLRLYPGCDRTIATCQSKYGNEDNFGGCPHLPGKSPFDGNPVF